MKTAPSRDASASIQTRYASAVSSPGRRGIVQAALLFVQFDDRGAEIRLVGWQREADAQCTEIRRHLVSATIHESSPLGKILDPEFARGLLAAIGERRFARAEFDATDLARRGLRQFGEFDAAHVLVRREAARARGSKIASAVARSGAWPATSVT